MKLYIVKSKSETLNDVFNGWGFFTIFSKTLKSARSLKKKYELDQTEEENKLDPVQILEVTFKKVK